MTSEIEKQASLVHKEYTIFSILGNEVNLISDYCACGINTVAEVNDQFYYLGCNLPTIGTAIIAWENIFNKKLSDKDFHQVLIDNNIL